MLIDFPPVKLYLNDIRDIWNVLKDNNCQGISIQTTEYEVSETEQLKNIINETMHTLIIRSSNPYITLEFRPYQSRFYANEDSAINRGILSQIQGILNRSKRGIDKILNKELSSIIATFIWGGLIVLVVNRINGSIAWLLIGLITFLFIAVLVYSYRMFRYRYSIIIPTEKSEDKNFFVRNKDKLLVGIIVAVFSVLLTLLITKLFQ